MNTVKKILSKKLTIFFIILLLAVTAIGRKVAHLSDDPKGEKNCSSLFSLTDTDSGKPTTLEIHGLPADLPWIQKGGNINDASCLSETDVFGIVKVREEKDIQEAITFAREHDLKVSIAGVKHSMGGQAFFKHAVVLDMTEFNDISLDEENKVMRVQSGATWHDIQNVLHPKFAVKAMQSTDIFTVGGSISVNAHGMDHQVGALGGTIRSMRVMLPDGSIKNVSRTENSELFRLVLGGYGLFGVVVDADIEITENVVYETKRIITDYKNFPELFEKEILPNENIGLMYSHLSTAPQSFLEELIIYKYEKTEDTNVKYAPLTEVSNVKLRRFVINFAKYGSIPQRIKWFVEKHVEPRFESCTVNRNQALKEGEACLVSRNHPMHDSVKYLRNNLKNDTDILHEYFIPRDQFVSFVDGMREILKDNKTNVLNASVRVVHEEDITLNYAPEDMFSLVLYINQKTDPAANEEMKKVTQELINLTTQHGGRFFLPYQLHYTPEQLRESYPEIEHFFDEKRKYDPDVLFTNSFYEKYSDQISDSASASIQ